MDEERFQQMEKRLNEQAEAIRAMNETLRKFLAVMGEPRGGKKRHTPPGLTATCNYPSEGVTSL
jgi:hypothetical protein